RLLREEREGPRDREIPCTTAEVPAQVREQLVDRRRTTALLEETDQGDHEPRSAVAALKGSGALEGVLNDPAVRVVGHALDRRERRPFRLVREREAGEGRHSVHEHRARSTVAAAAPLLRALELEAPAQRVEEALRVGDALERVGPAVDGERE